MHAAEATQTAENKQQTNTRSTA